MNRSLKQIAKFSIVKRSGQILLESVPLGVSVEDVKHDLEQVIISHPIHLIKLTKSRSAVPFLSTNSTSGASRNTKHLPQLTFSPRMIHSPTS
jgi:Co/Zn/Cd efflux system component